MRAPTQAIVALLAALVVTAIVSCRQAAGIGDPDPPLHCATPAFALPSCNECLTGRCCEQVVACNGDAACRSLLDCYAACKDGTCRTRCEQTSVLTEPSAQVLACLAGTCDVACGFSCGGVGAPVTECQPCGATCCAEAKAMMSDPDLYRLTACYKSCRDLPCATACDNTFATGAHLHAAARECISRSCNITGEWACIGGVIPQKSEQTSLTITVTATDSLTSLPIAGVHVKGCSASDLMCATPPHGEATTNDLGVAKLTIALVRAAALDAYPGFIELGRAGYPAHLLYFSPPLVRDVTSQIVMVSNAVANEVAAAPGSIALAPDRGGLVIVTTDCIRQPRSGISLRADTADAASRRFYLKPASGGGLPYDFLDATSTTELGIAGIFNLRAGPVKVTTRVDALCADSASMTLGIRAGALTMVNLAPTPNLPPGP